MHLQQRFLFYTQSFPVKVTGIGSSSFSFVAGDGHPEGSGRTINFHFWRESAGGDACSLSGERGGTNKLTISTLDDGSSLVNWWGVRNANFFMADHTWQDFADNIRSAYWWQMNDGTSNPIGPVLTA